jgi:transcriptional regulator with XRE-family HTH domain
MMAACAATVPEDDRVAGLSYQIGAEVRRRRIALGMTKRNLALMMEIAPPTIAALEDGNRNWSPRMIEKAAKALRVMPWVLLMPDDNFVCWRCHGTPEKLMQCRICGREG